MFAQTRSNDKFDKENMSPILYFWFKGKTTLLASAQPDRKDDCQYAVIHFSGLLG